jgi:hypothetical protein
MGATKKSQHFVERGKQPTSTDIDEIEEAAVTESSLPTLLLETFRSSLYKQAQTFKYIYRTYLRRENHNNATKPGCNQL